MDMNIDRMVQWTITIGILGFAHHRLHQPLSSSTGLLLPNQYMNHPKQISEKPRGTIKSNVSNKKKDLTPKNGVLHHQKLAGSHPKAHDIRLHIVPPCGPGRARPWG
jgi:hypothetical protein